MTAYEIAKVRPYKDSYINEFYFAVTGYSKYYERMNLLNQAIEENWQMFGESGPRVNFEVYGKEQAIEHRAELIAGGKYRPEELKIIAIERNYLD